jgi:hypothetical protein
VPRCSYTVRSDSGSISPVGATLRPPSMRPFFLHLSIPHLPHVSRIACHLANTRHAFAFSYTRCSVSRPFHNHFSTSTTMGSIPVEAPRVRVLIAGGSYGGLATALNLLDLGDGISPRMAYEPVEHHPDVPKVDYDITIVDERDGFCTGLCILPSTRRAWLTSILQTTQSGHPSPSPTPTTQRRPGSSTPTYRPSKPPRSTSSTAPSPTSTPPPKPPPSSTQPLSWPQPTPTTTSSRPLASVESGQSFLNPSPGSNTCSRRRSRSTL